MKNKKVIIIGDTRYFHIGSYVNFTYLEKIIANKFNLLGVFGDSNFYFKDYNDFLSKIESYEDLNKKIIETDIIFFNGEGYMEPDSVYADALLYLVKYIRNKWPDKILKLINFSCFDCDYCNWKLFDEIVVRDIISFECLKKVIPNISLGFDFSILQDIELSINNDKDLILIFRGRRDITQDEISNVKKTFSNKKVLVMSTFWKFDHDTPEDNVSLEYLKDKLSRSFLVVSSSFHGIIFATCFGIPFIPIETIGTLKNSSIAFDILGKYFRNNNVNEWLNFLKDANNYIKIKKHLVKIVPKLKKRVLKNLG